MRPTLDVIQLSRDDSDQARACHHRAQASAATRCTTAPVNACLLGAVPEALLAVWGMVRRQTLDPAGVAPPTAELTDTDPAAIRWAAGRMRAEWAARRHTTPVADMTGTQFCDAAGLTRRPPASRPWRRWRPWPPGRMKSPASMRS